MDKVTRSPHRHRPFCLGLSVAIRIRNFIEGRLSSRCFLTGYQMKEYTRNGPNHTGTFGDGVWESHLTRVTKVNEEKGRTKEDLLENSAGSVAIDQIRQIKIEEEVRNAEDMSNNEGSCDDIDDAALIKTEEQENVTEAVSEYQVTNMETVSPIAVARSSRISPATPVGIKKTQSWKPFQLQLAVTTCGLERQCKHTD